MHGKMARPDPEHEKKCAQQEAQRQIEANRREERERRRGLCDLLRFSRFCADLRCKRARRCAGDVERCFNFFWPLVPDDVKNEIRHAIKLRSEGVPPQQAAHEAREFIAQRKRIERATLEREAARRSAPPPIQTELPQITRSAPRDHQRGPRVRGL